MLDPRPRSSSSSVSRAVRSHVNARRARPRRGAHPRRAARRRPPAAARPRSAPAPSSASSPVCRRRSTPAARRPRSAALGVPHVAASITVRHQPSAEEAVRFTHARAYSSRLLLLGHVPVQDDALAQPARGDLRLQRRPVVALAGDVEHGARHVPRARRAAARSACSASAAPGRAAAASRSASAPEAPGSRHDAEVAHVDCSAGHAERERCRRLADSEIVRNGAPRYSSLQRQRLGEQRRHARPRGRARSRSGRGGCGARASRAACAATAA